MASNSDRMNDAANRQADRMHARLKAEGERMRVDLARSREVNEQIGRDQRDRERAQQDRERALSSRPVLGGTDTRPGKLTAPRTSGAPDTRITAVVVLFVGLVAAGLTADRFGAASNGYLLTALWVGMTLVAYVAWKFRRALAITATIAGIVYMLAHHAQYFGS